MTGLFSSPSLLLLLLLLVMVLPVVRGRRVVLLPVAARTACAWVVVLGRAAADLQGRGLHRVAVVRPLAV